MKQTLSDLYEQVFLSEAEKHALQNPSQNEVGKLPKENIFGSKLKAVEGPDKAKLKQGPAYKETVGSSSKPSATKSSMPNSAPAKEAKADEPEEVEGTKAEPKKEEDDEKDEKETKKKEVKQENFNMSAFETLFKKTLTEEIDEVVPPAPEMEAEDNELDMEEEVESTEENLEEEESDLISDLRDLQDRLSSILSKLEDVQEEEEQMEETEEYSDEDFEEEFGEEEMEESPVKESFDRPKALSDSKGKTLMSKKNKVGRLNPKGGKAHGGSLKNEPKPKALGDKKGALQKGKPEVKSTIKKGDFIK